MHLADTKADPAHMNQYGVRFLEMEESVRVKIMTWVFAEQARRFHESKKGDEPDS